MSTVARSRRERGAAAVEMAIILPLLLLVVAGIIDLGRLLFVQTMVTNAAREGARMASMGYDLSSGGVADQRVNNSSPGVGTLAITYVACPSTITGVEAASATVTTTNFTWIVLGDIAGLFGAAPAAPQPTATASMRCLG